MKNKIRKTHSAVSNFFFVDVGDAEHEGQGIFRKFEGHLGAESVKASRYFHAQIVQLKLKIEEI